jgi:hypothetical protein
MFMVRIRNTWPEDVFKLFLFLARVCTRGTVGSFWSGRCFPGAIAVNDVSATIIITPHFHFVRVHGNANAPIVFFPQHGDRPLRALGAGIVRYDDLRDGLEHRVRRGILGQFERCAEATHGGRLGTEHVRRLLVAEEWDEPAVERRVREGRARVQRRAGERAVGGESAGEVVRLCHHDGVFGEQIGPWGWWMEGFELPCECLDRVDQLRHSELYRLERRDVRRWSAEIWWKSRLCWVGLGLGGHGWVGDRFVRDRVTALIRLSTRNSRVGTLQPQISRIFPCSTSPCKLVLLNTSIMTSPTSNAPGKRPVDVDDDVDVDDLDGADSNNY